jgi:SAM-dependent methyltransferase
MANLFDSSSMGAGYANARPPIHPLVMELVMARLKPAGRFRRALDVGCGAGLSTRAVFASVEQTIAIDPYESMLRFGASVAPGAHFLAARAEELPVRSNSIDLITAAGSLNYTDLRLFFPEAVRVLRGEGWLVVYDFSQGRRFSDSPALDTWFNEFLARYPAPPDPINHLDGETLGRVCQPLRMDFHQPFEVGVTLSHEFYVNYMMTETNISNAVACGATEPEIRVWIASSLQPVFDGKDHEILFNGYFACLKQALPR